MDWAPSRTGCPRTSPRTLSRSGWNHHTHVILPGRQRVFTERTDDNQSVVVISHVELRFSSTLDSSLNIFIQPTTKLFVKVQSVNNKPPVCGVTTACSSANKQGQLTCPGGLLLTSDGLCNLLPFVPHERTRWRNTAELQLDQFT